MEGDTVKVYSFDTVEIFQSTPSVWRETFGYYLDGIGLLISIHSLRVEGDFRAQ